jgi:hypothetical protein
MSPENNDHLYKDFTDKYVQGQHSIPLVLVPVSPQEQSANAELTTEKAHTEKENRNSNIRKRWLQGGVPGFFLGVIVGLFICVIVRIN